MTLKDKLLSIGGEEVNVPFFEFHEYEILNRGNIWEIDNTEVVVEFGEANQCHKNASELWSLNKDDLEIYIVSGYALIDDDESTWLQHSWLLLRENGKETIIETTLERDIYFGYILNEVESKEFFDCNYE